MIKVLKNGTVVELSTEEDIILGLFKFIGDISDHQLYDATRAMTMMREMLKDEDERLGPQAAFAAMGVDYVNTLFNVGAYEYVTELLRKVDGDVGANPALVEHQKQMQEKIEEMQKMPIRLQESIQELLAGFEIPDDITGI